jgi:Cu-Zn family superoxide dismutase
VRLRVILPVLVLAVATPLAGCGGKNTATPFEQVPPVRFDPQLGHTPDRDARNTVSGMFLPYTPGATAITYDPAAVPAGSMARLTVARRADGVTVRLKVTGMVPRRSYGAHLHTASCTGIPEQAGPHYQHMPDPKAGASRPSVDPGYANPRNEVWLDFTADGTGAALVGTSKRWTFDRARPPRSLVLHADSTRTGKGVAGMAGPRVACLSVPR